MNPDQPSREQIEARITALLLGELPADEAALLRYTISQDPALQKLHDELQAALPLVREAEKTPAELQVEKTELLKLSAERREKLLAHFKTQRTKETSETQAAQEPLFWLKRIKVLRPTRVFTVVALVAIFGLLAAIYMSATRNLSSAGRGTYGTDHGLSIFFSDLKDHIWSSAGEKQESLAATKSTPKPVSPADTVTPGHSWPEGNPETLTLSDGENANQWRLSTSSFTNATYGSMRAVTASASSGAEVPFVNSALQNPPAVSFAAPLPQPVAPPPASIPNTRIVLPQTEPTFDIASQTEKPDETGKSHVFSQTVVGYVNLPANSSAPQPPVAQPAPANNSGSFALQTAESEAVLRQAKVVLNKNQWDVTANVNGYSPDLDRGKNTRDNKDVQWAINGLPATGGFGGGGGGGGAVTTPMPANTPSAQAAPPPAAAAPAPLALPPGAAFNAPADQVAVTESAGRSFINAEVQNHGAAGLAGNRFYRKPAPKTEEQNVTTFSDASVAGSVPPAETPLPVATTTPAEGTEYTIVSGDTLSRIARKDGVTLKALEEANPGVDPKKLKLGKKLIIPAPTAYTTAARPRAAGEPTLGLASDSPATELAKDDSEHLNYSINNSPLQQHSISNNQFTSRYAYTGLPSGGRPDLTGANYIATNGFVMNTFSPGVSGVVTNDLEWLGVLEHPSKPGVSPYDTNEGRQQEMIAPGLIDYEGVDLNEVLKIYGKLANRTVLQGSLPQAQINFKFDTPLTKTGAIQALQAVLALNGVSLINIGDKYVKVIPSDQAAGAGEEIPGTESITRGGDIALYKGQEHVIATNQAYVEELRQKLHITDDPHAMGPTPTLDTATLQMINSHKIEEEKIYQEQLAQLQELKSIEQTNRGKLTEMLPQIAGDRALSDLIAKRDEAGRTLTNITNDYSVNNGTVQRTASLLNELNREIDNRTTGLMAGLESRVASTKGAVDGYTAELEEAQKNNVEEAKRNQPYYDARRELDEKLKQHELLYSKLEAEKLDMSFPASSMVQITDPAEPIRNQTFWHRLTGQYASTARIKVENDATDIPGMALNSPAPQGIDPYFVQTTFEVMQSPLVLSNVVEKLDLTSAWAKKNGGQKMSETEAIAELRKRLDLQTVKNTKLIAISVTSDDPNEAANIANAVAQAYRAYRLVSGSAVTANELAVLEEQFARQEKDIQVAQAKVQQLAQESTPAHTPEQKEFDLPLRKPAPNTPVPQPEILARDNNFSTFSLNVSDVSFKFAEASLQNGKLPDTASIRSEEFINAFDYRDPEAAPGQPMAFTSERARYPFAHNRELLRFAIKTAAAGRQQGRALNLVLLLDNSGSMERADRVAIIREALSVLATQLQPQDTVSVVTFSRTARLWADGVSGDKAGETLDRVGGITPEGGTNLEEAMRLAYETAHRHYLANGINRVVLLTDGAANLGDVNPADLKQKVEAQRKQGIALDCFGIGWEDFNDDLLEQLSSNGDGRYAFLNSPEDAAKDFAAKLAGALQIAAADVKVQVEFNPQRVISYRQIGYATHQLTKEQFRDNTVAAGQIAAQESGNALYTIEINPNGEGPVATVHVRYKVPGTEDYREHSWNVDYTGGAPALDQSSPAMRLAATASAFSEWLAASPYAQEVTPDALLKYLTGVPEVYGADDRPKQLETMIREAKSLEGK